MIADSIAFLAGAGKRVLFDAEHFFDGFSLDRAMPWTACARRPGGRGAPGPVRHQRRLSAAPDQDAFAVVAEACRVSRWDPPMTTRAAASPTR